MPGIYRPGRLATRAASFRYGGRHHPGIPGGIIPLDPGGFVGIRSSATFSASCGVAVYEDEQRGIAHAQPCLGSGMIMLGSVRDDEFGILQATPATLGWTTQSPYIVVPDANIVYQRAKASAAEIVFDIKDEDHGGRVFSCRDPEGHLWNICAYDPWKAPS